MDDNDPEDSDETGTGHKAGEIHAEPTDDQREEYENVLVLGGVDVEEFSGFENQLSPQERIHVITGIVDEKGKRILAVTNQRLINFSSSRVVQLGEKNRYTDIKIDDISDIHVETRKDFDILVVNTEQDEKRFMLPEDAGVRVAGEIRDMQTNLDTAEQIENLAEQHEKGNLTDDEYERKKRELVGDD